MRTDIQKHTLNLRKGDWDYLESMFKPNGVATAVAVRTLISNFVDRKRKEEALSGGGSLNELDVRID
jgi:hypothetical protein